jgi:hypothetical protein
MKGRADSSNITRRYEPFRDERGEWSFEIREYQADLNLITPSDVPATPSPSEAYRVVVFLEGYIQEKKSTGDWSEDALDEFNVFTSTTEVEAVAKALREIADCGEN